MMAAKSTSLILALFAAACAPTPPLIVQLDRSLKNFERVPGVAALYVYRIDSLGGAVPIKVEIDKTPFGSTTANSYLYIELEPGKHTVTAKAENTDTLEIDAAGGELYFIRQKVKPGVLSIRTELHLASEAQGQRGVRQAKLVPP